MLDFLVGSGEMVAELIARTSSTTNVQHIVQISLAPVFLLAAIAAFLNVINGRLIWLADRVNRLNECEFLQRSDSALKELPVLRQRQAFAYRSANLSIAAALLTCTAVALMFVSAFVRAPIGTFVAGAWILAMALVFAALFSFLKETKLATRSANARQQSYLVKADGVVEQIRPQCSTDIASN